MKQDKIVQFLKAVNSKRTGYRSGWIEANCPLGPWAHANGVDASPSFGIKESSKNKSICKCLSCGWGGDMLDLVFHLSHLQKKHPAEGYNLDVAAKLATDEFDDLELSFGNIPDYGDEPIKHEIVFPEEWLASFRKLEDFPDAVNYVTERMLSGVMVEALDMRYDPLQRRVCFPFRNFSGKLVGVQSRAIDKDVALRYYQYGYQGHRNGFNWMGENIIDLDKPVVLLEGPFDYASVFRCYQNVAASFTSGLSVEKCKRLSDVSEIITFYDYGMGGTAARSRIEELFKGVPITHIVPTQEQDDAGNMSLDEVWNSLEGHVKLNSFG